MEIKINKSKSGRRGVISNARIRWLTFYHIDGEQEYIFVTPGRFENWTKNLYTDCIKVGRYKMCNGIPKFNLVNKLEELKSDGSLNKLAEVAFEFGNFEE